jgi:serine/threonine-protein kinase
MNGRQCLKHCRPFVIATVARRKNRMSSPTEAFDPKATPADNVSLGTLLPPTVVENIQPRAAVLPAAQGSYGRYAIVKEHAQGGLGKVSLAKDTKLGRTVALKEIRPDRQPNPEALQRFIKEAAITGLLEHPGIVPIYSLDEGENGKPYYAMRFIEGQSLQKALEAFHTTLGRGPETVPQHGVRARSADRAPAEFRKLLHHFLAVCNAIAFAHSKGVIHRDLKPENVMLGEYGETLVVDWGLAKQVVGWRGGEVVQSEALPVEMAPPHDLITSPPLTLAGQIMGTPAYMSPEQARGEVETLGPGTDIYALGGILFALLTGQPPYVGPVFDVIQKVQRATAAPEPRTVKKDVPAALAAICVKAMAPQVAERYASAKELAAEVERWLADEPVAAYAEPWTGRVRRWVKRHRTLATSAILLLISITASAILIAVLSDQRRQQVQAEKENTERQRQEAVAAQQKAQTAEEAERLAKEKALAARDRERTAKITARRAVVTLFTDQHLKQLEKQGKLTKDQLEQLQAMADFYRNCAQEAGGSEAEMEKRAADYFQLAKVLNRLGQKEEAVAAYRLSLGIGRQLFLGDPDDPDYIDGLGNVWNNLGILYFTLDRLQEAETSHREALKLRERLVRKQPRIAQHHADLAASWNNLGEALNASGKHEEAMANFQRAHARLEQLVRDVPNVPYYRWLLGIVGNNLAVEQTLLGQMSAALGSLQRARQLNQQLAEAAPQTAEYQFGLARTWACLGYVHRATGRLREAEASYQQAQSVYQRLVADYPNVPDYQASLARVWISLGNVQVELHQQDRAEESYNQARLLALALTTEYSRVPPYRAILAKVCHAHSAVLAQRQQWPEAEAGCQQARQLLEELVQMYPATQEYGLELGTAYLQSGELAQRQHQHETALAWWEKAEQTLLPRMNREHRDVYAWERLCEVYHHRGITLHRLGRWAAAVRAFHAALAWAEGGKRSTLLQQRHQALEKALVQADFLARQGWHFPTMQMVAVLAPLTNLPAETWLSLARILASCSASQGTWFLASPTPTERDRYAAQAVAMLRHVCQQSFFARMAQGVRWYQDAALAPLRDRADFRHLLLSGEK